MYNRHNTAVNMTATTCKQAQQKHRKTLLTGLTVDRVTITRDTQVQYNIGDSACKINGTTNNTKQNY